MQALNTLSMTWKKMYNLDPSTDTGAYILGILWGTMSVGEKGGKNETIYYRKRKN